MCDRSNIIEGLPPIIPLPEVSFGEVIHQSFLQHEDEDVALYDGYSKRKVTYYELIRQTCSLAEALRINRYDENSVIAICSQNNLQYFFPIISAMYIGATVALVNFDYTVEELEGSLGISKPKVVFCSEALVEKFYELKKKLIFIEKIIVIDSGDSTAKAVCLRDFIEESLDGAWTSTIATTPVDIREHVAFIMNSSGTTGLPKGVMLTHNNMNTLYAHFKDPRIHDQESVTLCVAPFFHAYGLCTTITGLMIYGSVVVFKEFEVQTFLKAVETYKIKRLFVVPPLVVFLSKSELVEEYNLSSIKEIISAAAPLKESTEREIKKRLNLNLIRQAYGLTETTFAVVYSGREEEKWKPGSSGKVTPYMKFAIRDIDTGEFLGPYESGEVCIKGEMVMKGYYNNPEATKHTFTDDGWFLTGDVGYYDNEYNFYITDRIKELIKFNGFQVPPAELEALLLSHTEIRDCGVVGLPDERSGELPVAFVVRKDGSSLKEIEVQDFVRRRISQNKWLRGGVIFVDEIPKTASGKILRRKLRILAQEVLMGKK
ncbi:luciferin 4-monooxygenase-like [Coccinella septempunctata]|uniref:luciferin 4-monooxygenase-like n=1 Tax=Coccinella septempunctata TaxID=41139 RepID=UPI001D08FAE4|nr:luciferin 4-monooxygenase-like [Coccinella septempunctata]